MNTPELEHRFIQIYGKRAEHSCFASGRVDHAGIPTGYNGGSVFPCALNFGTCLLISKRKDRQNHFSNVNLDRSYRIGQVKISQKAENDSAVHVDGIMGQFAIADRAIALDCSELKHDHVPLHTQGHKPAIAQPDKKRGLTGPKYDKRRSKCKQAVTDISENARKLN